MSAREFDLIVIGAGAVGENVADRAVQGGLTVALVEAELVGGECSYWACMPSKALLRAGAAVRDAADVDGAAQAITGPIDPLGVLRRRDAIVHDWDDASQVAWVDGAGIELIRGHARFTGPKALAVTAADGTVTELRATHAVTVSTGSAALLPDVPGLREAAPWTSRDATSVKSIPASLAILGGGVVGCEMATAYASLGCAVTLLSRGPLLSNLEPVAGEAVTASLRRLGVDVRIGAEAAAVQRGEHGVVVELKDDSTGGSTVTADELLVAIGRTPRTGDLGLEAIGLTPGDWLTVDDTLRVEGFDWLYATGDVNHRALLTHQGKYQARAAGDVIAARALGRPVDDAPWGRHVATADAEAVPQVTFTDPEVASVGLTEAAARRAGYDIRVVDYELGWVAGASALADHYEGHARAVIDASREVLIGVTFVGRNVSEMLQAATIAIVGEVPLKRLWHAVPAYPTLNEVWLRLLETDGRGTA
ncbi:dihydrolipoyl dehydrogenase family protein [Lysinimonas soli]|uniref:Dihydrolipoyl dehydrogenase family protein n=1 Tax=Lysinimonas soli TaxID=1074233 RepID=A0ABW0NLC4_9MICO